MNKIFTTFSDFVNENYNTEVELNEAFKSSKLASILGLDLADKDIMKAIYNFTKVKLDQITDDQVVELHPAEAYKTKAHPNALFFYISDNQKPNPYATADTWHYKNIPGNALLAVANGKNEMYALEYGSRWGSEAGKRTMKNVGRYGDGTGIDKKHSGYDSSGLSNIKRISEVSDRVLMFDPSILPSAAEEKDARAAAKKGAVAFMTDKEFKAENMKRYTEILANRAANDDVDGIVEKSINLLTKHISDAMKSKTMGRYNDIIIGLDPKGREIKISDAANMVKNILDSYSKYVDYTNQAAQGDKWYAREAKSYAKDIVDRSKKVEKKDYAW